MFWSTISRLRRATCGQPRGHVDRRAEDVAEPLDDRAAGEAEADVGHLRVAPDDVDDPLGDADRLLGGVGDEEDRVAQALDDPAAVAGHDVLAAALEDLDEVADLVAVEGVGQRGEGDQVGEPDADVDRVEVLVLGSHRLDPAHRGGEVAAPGVDEEPLEGRVDLVDEAQRRPDARAGGLLARLHLLDAADQRGDLPVGEAGHGLADAAREVDGRVEVDGARVDEAHEGGDGLDVGGRVGLLAGELREAQRAPQPAGLLDRDAGLGGDLEGVEGRLAAQDRVVELLPRRPLRAGVGEAAAALAVRRHRRGGRHSRGGGARRRPAAGPARRRGCRGAGRCRRCWRRRRRACRSRRSGRSRRSRSRRR